MVGVRQFDEQEVIAQALEVFRRKGLSEATMQHLAAATGVQRGSLYNAYGDKEAIFLRAYDQYAREFFEIAAKSLSGPDVATRLRNFLDLDIVHMTSGAPARGCLTTRTALDAGISSEEVRERVQGLLDGLEKIVSHAIASAPGKSVDADRLARVVVTYTRGLAVMERAGYSRKQLKEMAAAFVDSLALR